MSEKAALVLGVWLAVTTLIHGIKPSDDRVGCGCFFIVLAILTSWAVIS